MVIRLIPKQVPQFWESIKYAVKNADCDEGTDFPAYCNELLHSLLNEKAQCFVRLDEERKLIGVLVTRIMENKQTGEQYLYLQALYSWQFQRPEVWLKEFEILKDFAKSTNCKYLSCTSSNKRAWEIYASIGLTEQSRQYTYRL